MREVMNRRTFLDQAGRLLLGSVTAASIPGMAAAIRADKMTQTTGKPGAATRGLSLFLSGDVMTGRGIDQVLPHPGDPTLHEP